MVQKKEDKQLLGLAGEYGVCSELAKRGIIANMTFGNNKAVDVTFVNRDKKQISIQVKTSRSSRIVTGFFQKYKT